MKNDEGMHLRTAMDFSKVIKNFDCKTTIITNGQELDASNVLNVVAACITKGTEFSIVCDGPQEEDCVAAIRKIEKELF